MSAPARVVDNMALGHVAPSAIHGLGLFASCDLPAGAVLGVLDGQVMDWGAYDELASALDPTGAFADTAFMEWNALDESTLLVRPFRTKYSYVNHSREPNCRILRHPLRVVTVADVAEGDELTLDYREEPLRREYLDGHGSTYL